MSSSSSRSSSFSSFDFFSLSFPRGPGASEEFFLVEMPENLLKQFLEKTPPSKPREANILIPHRSIIEFRGPLAADAAIASAKETFSVKLAETSNSLVLISQPTTSASSTDIHGFSDHYYEIQPIAPRLGALREILYQEGNLIKENREKKEHFNVHITQQDLEAFIQASSYELAAELFDLNSFVWLGGWRVVEPAFLQKILLSVRDFIIEKRLSFKKLPVEEVASGLAEIFPPALVKEILNNFSSSQGAPEGKNFLALDDRKWQKFFAVALFSRRASFPVKDFLDELWRFCPPGMKFLEGAVAGLAFLEEIPIAARLMGNSKENNGNQDEFENSPAFLKEFDDFLQEPGLSLLGRSFSHQFHYFPVFSCADNEKIRLQQLFSVKAKWTLPEIAPFFEGILPAQLSVEQFLVKNARAITENKQGEKQILYMKR